MLVRPFKPGPHGIHRKMGGAHLLPGGGELVPIVGLATGDVNPALDAYGLGVPSGRLGMRPHLANTLLTRGVGLELREPAVAQAADPPHHPVGVAAEPDRDGPLHRSGVDARVGDLMVPAFKGDHFLGPEVPEQLDLLDAAPSPVVEVLSQGFVLYFVPTNADPQPQPPAG